MEGQDQAAEAAAETRAERERTGGNATPRSGPALPPAAQSRPGRAIILCWHAWSHTHRGLVLVAEGVGALLGLVALAAMALAIRLEAGPVEIDFLTPALTASLDQMLDPLSVTASHSLIRLDLQEGTLGLRAEGVRVTAPDGSAKAAIPDLVVSFRLGRLLLGQFVPTRLIVDRPMLTIVRTDDGSMPALRSTDDDDASALPAPAAPQWIRALANPHGIGNPIAHLQTMKITEGEIRIEDRRGGPVWTVDRLEGGINHGTGGFALTLASRLAIGTAAPVPLTANVTLDEAGRSAAGAIDLGTVEPAALAPLIPGLAGPLAMVQLPVSVHVEGNYSLGSMQPKAVRLKANFGTGSLVGLKLPGGTLPVTAGSIEADWSEATRRFTVDGLNLDIGGPLITLSGHAEGVDAALWSGASPTHPVRALLHVDARSVPVERLPLIWPDGLAPGGRNWIAKNLSDGMIDDAAADLGIAWNPGAEKPVALNAVNGTMKLRGTSINFLDGLPHIEGASANATLGLEQIEFTMTGGHLTGLELEGGTVTIDQFDAPTERITIDLGIAGPARDLAVILNSDRLKYTRALGLRPDQVSGDLDGTLHFRFPLRHDVTFADMEIGADASVTGLGLLQIARGQDLTDGRLRLVLNAHDITVKGTAAFGGTPASLAARQRISGHDGNALEAEIAATLDDAARRRLGLDPLPDFVRGAIGARVTYAARDAHRATADIALNLDATGLELPWIGWRKPPGPGGTANFRLDVIDQRVARIDRVRVLVPGLELRGLIDLDRGGELRRAQFDRVRTATTDASVTVEVPGPRSYDVTLRGTSLDLSALLNPPKSKNDKPTVPAEAPPSVAPSPSIRIDAALDRLILGPDRAVAKVRATGLWQDDRPAEARLSADFVKSGTVWAWIAPDAAGGGFALQSDNVGEMLRVAGLTDQVVGGTLALVGNSRAEPGGRRFAGHLEGQNYRVVRLPFLARLLSIASFESLASLLDGEGLPFTALTADLVLEQGRLTASHARAYGGAIGLNLDGWLDFRARALDFRGTVVPANTLNTLISDVPLLGKLLVGDPGQGLFAVNIALGGRLDEPTITVNPLSLFAPGYLRRLPVFDAPDATAATAAQR